MKRKMLKAEWHSHVRGDWDDNIKYSARQLIDRAAELNFNVLGITNHRHIYEEEGIKEYALSRNIILFLGVELHLQGRHTLVYNVTNEQIQNIRNLADLELLKKEHPEILIIAPHPFHYGNNCHKENILRHLALFDAWEYSFFYCRYCNPNKRTLHLAKKYHKPMVGCSDVHRLQDLGNTYTLITLENEENEKYEINETNILEAIRKGNTQIVTKPLPLLQFIYIGIKAVLSLF